MTAILIYSEQRDTALELVAKARELGAQLSAEVCAACLGGDTAADAAALAAHGAARVYTSDDAAFDGLATDVVANALAQLAGETAASLVLLGSTRRGRELAGRLAQKLGAACATDATSLDVDGGIVVAGRYNLGGATVQREALTSPVAVVAAMPKVFEAGEPPAGAAGEIVAATLDLTASAVKVVERKPKEGESVDLAAAPRDRRRRPRSEQARGPASGRPSSPAPSAASSAAPRASPTSAGCPRTASSASRAPRRRPTSTSPSASRDRCSTPSAARRRRSSPPSTPTRRRRSSRSPTTASSATSIRSCRR